MNKELNSIQELIERKILVSEVTGGLTSSDKKIIDLWNYTIDLQQENRKLKKQIEEYQKALDDTMSEKMDLEEENKKYKEVIDNVSSQIKLYGKYNGEKCTRGFSMMTADFNKLLDSLKEV